MVTAIIAAAGKSERMGAQTDKCFLSLGQKPVIAWSLLAFERCADIDDIILVVRKDQIVAAKAVAKMFGISKLRKIIHGGQRRQDSVQNALKEMDPDTRTVLVHDGARPCITSAAVAEIVRRAKKEPTVLAQRIHDTVKRVGKGSVVEATEDRSKLWAAQTPQGFPASALRRAYAEAEKAGLEVSDDSQAVEAAGGAVKLYEYEGVNVKITTAADLQIAAAALKL